MKLLEKPCITLPDDVDSECVDLCNVLNRLPGVETRESCCGHCKQPYNVFFKCSDLRTLTRLGRIVDRRYSDGNFEIVLDSCDSHPKNCFWLRSRVIFETFGEMMNSVHILVSNIDYWFSNDFDEHFDTDNRHETLSKICRDKTEYAHNLNYTDLEDGKRLLEVGLPEDTCDMWWAERRRAIFKDFYDEAYGMLSVVERHEEEPYYYLSFSKASEQNVSCDIIRDIPCWTLGTLIQILRDEFPNWNVTFDTKDVFATNGVYEWAFLESTLIENVVECLEKILIYNNTLPING